MKRVKKLYNITETTVAIIQKIAKDQMLPESYALDNICLNYYRMLYKQQPIPSVITKQEHKTKKSEHKNLQNRLDFIENTLQDESLSQYQRDELIKLKNKLIEKINKNK